MKRIKLLFEKYRFFFRLWNAIKITEASERVCDSHSIAQLTLPDYDNVIAYDIRSQQLVFITDPINLGSIRVVKQFTKAINNNKLGIKNGLALSNTHGCSLDI